MFATDRHSLRRFYQTCWHKQLTQAPLTALEQQIVQVIQQHPEYQALLMQAELEQDYYPELGETNPFLHMGLHLSLQEQIATNRPQGIQSLYHTLLQSSDAHTVEHHMIDCLAEALWLAQRYNTAPDESSYWQCLQKLLSTVALGKH